MKQWMLALGDVFLEQRLQLLFFELFHRDAGQPRGDLAQRLPIMALIFLQRKNRCTPFRHITHHQVNKVRREIRVHRMRRAGQNHIRMARGLVQIDVERDHEVEAFKCLGQALRIGIGQHRVAGHGDKGADLAFARRHDFFNQCTVWKRAGELRQAADACLPAVHRRHIADEDIVEHHVRDDADRKHHATRTVDVAGQHIDHILQPARHGAETLRAGAESSIPGGAVGPGEFACELTNHVGRHGTRCRHPLRGILGRQRADGFDAAHLAFQVTQPNQILREQHVDDGQQEIRVGPRTNRDVLIGNFGSLGTARVDDDHFAAAFTDRLDALGHARCRQQAAIGNNGVTALNHEIVCPIHIRHRHCCAVTEHQRR